MKGGRARRGWRCYGEGRELRDARVLRVSLGSGCERALREGCWERRNRSLAGIDARAYFERVLGVVSRARSREGGVCAREERDHTDGSFVEWHSGPRTPTTRPLGEILTPPVIRDPLSLTLSLYPVASARYLAPATAPGPVRRTRIALPRDTFLHCIPLPSQLRRQTFCFSLFPMLFLLFVRKLGQK